MEGPSLVILMEDLAPFLGKKVVQASGVYPQAPLLVQQTLREAKSWGKHALLFFDDCILRIHFLLFGSYIINKEKEGRVPKLKLQFESGTVNFHACAIRSVSEQEIAAYDWSVDLMSPAWDARHVEELVMAQGSRPICDVLMDQDIFAGLGNIIKNEVLFLLKLHPDTPTSSLNAGMRRRLVQEVRDYSLQFYRWKKAGELKNLSQTKMHGLRPSSGEGGNRQESKGELLLSRVSVSDSGVRAIRKDDVWQANPT
jgi:endonuclease-8